LNSRLKQYLILKFVFKITHSQWNKQIDGKNIKIIPKDIDKHLSPIALAFWLAGDGAYNQQRGYIYIHTESFSLNEVDRLRDALLTNFDIHSTRNLHYRETQQYVIRIPKHEEPKVQALVKDIMPSSMRYRVGL
jgi:hypothetical protein